MFCFCFLNRKTRQINAQNIISSDEDVDEDEDEDSSDYDQDDDEFETTNKQTANTTTATSTTAQVTPDQDKTSTVQDGVIVDLLETEVDSLKAKLELTQSELYSLHNSNLDLTTQLRKTQAQQVQPCSTSKYSFTNASSNSGAIVTSMSSVMSSMASSKSSISTTNAVSKSSPAYDKSAYLEDELARTQKELAKQTSEVLSLKNQLSLKQVNIQIYSLQARVT